MPRALSASPFRASIIGLEREGASLPPLARESELVAAADDLFFFLPARCLVRSSFSRPSCRYRGGGCCQLGLQPECCFDTSYNLARQERLLAASHATPSPHVPFGNVTLPAAANATAHNL